MPRFFPLACFLATLFAPALPRGIAAPPDAAKFAVTQREEAGVDFNLQGEYLGMVATAYGQEYAGLQVVAHGDGKFDAVYLQGGLPAAGWNRRDRLKLDGEMEAGRLTLGAKASKSNVERGNLNYVSVVQVGGQSAIVTDPQGRELGRLEKIQRISPTLGAAPPAGAKVLFDGSRADQFSGGSVTADGLLNAGATTKIPVGDFRLHLEFRTPYMPYAREQGRGNSGVYIQQRYEVQILDSFGLAGAINECGSLYKQRPPDVNTCLPPLAWQTYDIYFTAARWNATGQKTAAARSPCCSTASGSTTTCK